MPTRKNVASRIGLVRSSEKGADPRPTTITTTDDEDRIEDR